MVLFVMSRAIFVSWIYVHDFWYWLPICSFRELELSVASVMLYRIAQTFQVLRDGVIVQAGKFEDLLQHGTDFSTLILAHNEALENMQTNMNIRKDAEMSDNIDKFVEKTKSEISNQQNNDGTGTDHEKNTTLLQQLVKEEERERGQVSYKVYWVYATAIAGGAFIPLYLFSAIGFQAFQILSNYWMAWGTSSTEGGSWQVSTKKLILVYILLAFSGSFCMLLRAMTISIIGLKTAQKYFLKMLRSIFRAPMSFFDSTPSGRILTRVCLPFPLLTLDFHK